MSDDASEITVPICASEDVIPSYDHGPPKQATRTMVDPSKVPRWTPSRRPGTVTAASRAALLSAVQQQNHRMIEQLLDSGVPPENHERNLITVAIVAGDFTSIRLLLLFGADSNGRDKEGYTPLFSAVQASFLDAAQLLLKYGANADLSGGPHDENPLARAVSSNQTQFVELFLHHGADPNIIMENGNTPFIAAINRTVPLNLIRRMLEYGVDPNGKNRRGESPLFRAINSERIDIVSSLLSAGANADLPGPKHMLWPAVHHPRILELLLEKGAKVNRAPGVLELATSINSLDAAQILLKHGADPNAKKDGIFTP
jgi:ankyrin repeat protein